MQEKLENIYYPMNRIGCCNFDSLKFPQFWVNLSAKAKSIVE